jgi:glycosyltransferase involved in cell wall biosynthesis
MLLRGLALAPRWRLLIAGPEGDMSFAEIETRIRNLQIGGKVILRRGFISSEEQPLYFGAADAVAGIYSPSIRHESGTSQLARAFLKPIVASGPPDLVEYVESNDVGWAVPRHTDEGVAATLFKVEAISDNQRGDLCRRINKCAEERSWSRVFEEIFKGWCAHRLGSSGIDAEGTF